MSYAAREKAARVVLLLVGGANHAESLETNKREIKIKRQRFNRGPLWFTYPSDPSVVSEVRWVCSAELLLLFSALLSLQDHYKRNYNS